MGRIQSNIGLITGMPIGETVDKLMALAARPRDMLAERNTGIEAEQLALSSLSASLLGVKYLSDKLGSDSLYDVRSASTSNSDVLTARVTGQPPKGTYQFTPLRMVQSQQLLSSGFRSDSDPLGAGKLTFRFGAHLERSAGLEHFNDGEGIDRGKIRITDRAGASAEIDLSTVRSVDDVLEAINADTTVEVTAVAQSGGFRLIDNTGQTASNLKVEEVSGGTTAQSLGLGGIDVAGNTADGLEMIRLYDDISLDALNDGSGVLVDQVLEDIEYELSDGTTGQIDLSPILSGSSTVVREQTLGEMLEVINAAEPDKLRAEIASDGQRLVITDLTAGSGTFQLESLYDSSALADLGLDGQAVDGVITGRRLIGGAKTVLLSSLSGGDGLGGLGLLDLTDRNGDSETVDLADAETLEELIDTVNDASVGIVASLNNARTGIVLTDTTGGYAGNMIVANGDAQTSTADKLSIAVDDAVNSVSSGDMHLQVIAHGTALDEMNGGAGVGRGTITIVDTDGISRKLDLSKNDIQTIGDVIQEINRLSLGVRAEINDNGDGIRLRDTAHGLGTLEVKEGGSSAAADLHLLGSVEEVNLDGETTQVIDGSTTYTVELDADDSLTDLVEKINELGGGATATMFSDGSSKPHRLSLASDEAGKAGKMIFDTSELGFSLIETVKAQDAMLVFGQASLAASSVLVTSSSNTFNDVLAGVSLTVKTASSSPVTVTVSETNASLIATIEGMVESYNSFRKTLGQLTEFNVETETAAALTGDSAALRLDTDLSYMLSGRFFGAGSIRSLAQIGIDIGKDGTLTFSRSEFDAKYAADSGAVRDFLTTEDLGFADKFGGLIDQLGAAETSLLTNRTNTLATKIQQNQARLDQLDARLELQSEQMYLKFYRMEEAIGKMQNSLSIVAAIQPIAIYATSTKK